MASFCNQCAIGLMVEPGDFYDQSNMWQSDLGVYRIVLCEDCGPITVDWEGNCMREDCDGERPHGHRCVGPASRIESAMRQWRRRTGLLGRLWRLRDTLLGSPWEPGLIHWWRWRLRDRIEIYKSIWSRLRGRGHAVRSGDDIWPFDDHPRCRCAVIPNTQPDPVGPQEPSTIGVETPRGDAGGSDDAGFPGEEDIRPISER